jgi:hypothetical protein
MAPTHQQAPLLTGEPQVESFYANWGKFQYIKGNSIPTPIAVLRSEFVSLEQ